MANLLFAKKSMNTLMAEANEHGSQTLERSLGPFSAHSAWASARLLARASLC